ncbi:MAG: trypsin-like peptidase domain-containing protein [Bacteroidales bacterium]|nr:trypsin-like peptidase domain-containing protein [Bacteroidales bacterium]
MFRKIWKQVHPSVCSIHFMSKAGTRITTFTGFKIMNYLITDDVIDKFGIPDSVVLRFSMEDGCSERASKNFSFKDFKKKIIRPGGNAAPGYVIICLEDPEFKDIPSLRCSRKINYDIGHPIAILGYQLEQQNLAIKSGIISSFFTNSDGLKYIQIDCSIKQGNAGSPLIDLETEEVVGVIGHRLAGIARSYKELMIIFNQNLSVLNEVQGKFNYDDIDPVQVLIANQNQIKHIATEFYKTANMGVGYAVDLCSLPDYCPDNESAMDLELKYEE